MHWVTCSFTMKSLGMVVCLEMAPKTNNSDSVFSLRTVVLCKAGDTALAWERDSIYSALLACCATYYYLLTLYYIVHFPKNFRTKSRGYDLYHNNLVKNCEWNHTLSSIHLQGLEGNNCMGHGYIMCDAVGGGEGTLTDHLSVVM